MDYFVGTTVTANCFKIQTVRGQLDIRVFSD